MSKTTILIVEDEAGYPHKAGQTVEAAGCRFHTGREISGRTLTTLVLQIL